MIIISCSHGVHLGAKIAKRLKAKHDKLFFEKFPDDEIYLRFNSALDNKIVVLVQSFYKSISDCLIEVILAAKTAHDIGAKKVILAAPYFPYLRQDKRFHKGEAVSQSIVASLISKYFDKVLVMDPHLHRKNKLENVFNVSARKMTANSLIADYINKNIKNPLIIGPDEESYKWARHVAGMIKAESRILKKKRFSSYHVKVMLNKKVDLKNRNAVIVDDIISTGHTILEASKILKKLGAKNIYCICVHGIFVNNSLETLRKSGIKVISTNTIPNKAAKIDVSGVISEALKESTLK